MAKPKIYSLIMLRTFLFHVLLKKMEPVFSVPWMWVKIMILIVILKRKNIIVLHLRMVLLYLCVSFVFYSLLYNVMTVKWKLHAFKMYNMISDKCIYCEINTGALHSYFFVTRSHKIWSLTSFWLWSTNINSLVSVLHYRSPEVTTQ